MTGKPHHNSSSETHLGNDDEDGDDERDGDVHPEEPPQEDEVGGDDWAEVGLDVLDPLLPGGDLGHALLDQFPQELGKGVEMSYNSVTSHQKMR